MVFDLNGADDAFQNLTSRRNVRGFEVSFELDDDEAMVEKERNDWGRLLPSVGLSWTF